MAKKTRQELVTLQTGKSYDIIVVGGGMAGVSAAVAARRQGKRVLLIEKASYLGGLATLGLVVLYHPPLDDGTGRKLVGGLAEELLHLSIRYSYDDLPKGWTYGAEENHEGGRYQTVFNAPAFALALNELLQAEQVDVLYDALFCIPRMEGMRCMGVSVETKAGRYYYSAKAFVDASGDGDLLFRAGADMVERPENALTFWMLSTDLERMQNAISFGDVGKAIRIEAIGANPHEDCVDPDTTQYGIRTPEEISEFISKGMNMGLQRLKTFDKTQRCLVSIPGMAEYRKTRALVGEYTISEKDREAHFEDSIGCTKEEFEPHCIEIPYRCLMSRKIDNIYAAGRIISSDGRPRDTIRLIAICAQTGEAAGLAASMLADTDCTAAQLNVSELQEKLTEAHNHLHF